MALTNAQRVVMLSGSRPAWATGMDMAWDWTTNRAWTANPITDTHSADISGQYQVGSFAPFAANTLVQTDLGLQTVPTRTNLLLRSNEFDNASVWINSNGAVSVTANAGTAPDGTQTADQWTFGAQFDGKRQTITVTGSQTYTYSVFIRRVGGTGNTSLSLTMQELAPTNVTNVNAITITDQWARYSATRTFAAGTTSVEFHVQDRNASGQGAIQVWGAQVELAAFASPPIFTTSSSATVNGNQQVVDLTGRLGSGVGVIWRFNMLDTTAQFKRIMGFNDGTGNNGFYVYGDTGSGTPLSQIVNAAINQGNVSWPGANVAGIQTWVMCAGPNYHRGQKIGQSAPAADTTVTWPTMTQLTIAGAGYNALDNAYQRTMQIGVKLGTANDAMFSDLVAKATILAAVS